MNSNRVSPTNAIGPLCLAILLFSALAAGAQTTEFTFQGSLKDGASPANGNYDFEFRLFDALSGGGQLGSTRSLNAVSVSAGIFTVKLDFGDQFSAGADRWVEIRVRNAGGSGFTILEPRTPINSIPYAVRSINAATANAMSASCIGCVNAANIASVNGAAVTGAIPVSSVPAGSANYIQNSVLPQLTSDFNITGNGSAGGRLSGNVVNAITRFELGGSRILALGSFGTSLFVGLDSGANNSGATNSFVGFRAGFANTTGNGNSFFGSAAGADNQTGAGNSFFGENAGQHNVSGARNSFFGSLAGLSSTGNNNSFFGREAGRSTTSDDNAFFGAFAGMSNTTGVRNSFFGHNAGAANTDGTENAFFGQEAGLSNTGGDHNAFFGTFAGSANTQGIRNSFLGIAAGRFNTTGSLNTFVGMNAGRNNIDGDANVFLGLDAGYFSTTGFNNTIVGKDAGRNNTNGSQNAFVGHSSGLTNTTGDNNVFIGADSGGLNVGGSANVLIGASSNVLGGSLGNAVAIGYRAAVASSNSIVLGSINGVNGSSSDTRVGIGTTTPEFRLDVADRVRIKQRPGATGTTSTAGLFLFQNGPNSERAFIGMENDNSVGFFGNNGGGWSLVMNTQTGVTSIRTFAAGGINALCRTAANEVGFCSSSLRYKTNIATYSSGMRFINRLRPISFDWKNGGSNDIGFGAEDIAAIDPRFVTRNENGEVEGVKYDRLSVVFVNALKEQQMLIESQQKQIDALKRLVCGIRPTAEVCKEVKK